MDDAINYFDKLQLDLLEQFRGKPNIEIFQQALAKQLTELYEFYIELDTLCWLKDAEGVQLDGIGDIVAMSRTDALIASKLAGKNVPMDDETYRLYLAFKMHLNTSSATHSEVYRALKMFWDKTPLYYSEDPAQPATMIFTTWLTDEKEDGKALGLAPKIKAAGVELVFVINQRLIEFQNTYAPNLHSVNISTSAYNLGPDISIWDDGLRFDDGLLFDPIFSTGLNMHKVLITADIKNISNSKLDCIKTIMPPTVNINTSELSFCTAMSVYNFGKKIFLFDDNLKYDDGLQFDSVFDIGLNLNKIFVEIDVNNIYPIQKASILYSLPSVLNTSGQTIEIKIGTTIQNKLCIGQSKAEILIEIQNYYRVRCGVKIDNRLYFDDGILFDDGNKFDGTNIEEEI